MQQTTDGNFNCPLDVRKTKKGPLCKIFKSIEEINDDRLSTFLKNKFGKNKNKNFKSIFVKYPKSIEEILQEVVLNVNNIVTNTYHFINGYILYEYENGNNITNINLPYVLAIIKRVSKRKIKSGRKGNLDEFDNKFKNFYNNFYKNVVNNGNIVFDDKLSQILQYEAKDIIKNINVNISEHYIQYVYKYVNIYFEIDKKIKLANKINNKNDKKIKKKQIYDELRLIKNDILNSKMDIDKCNLKSPLEHHKWIINIRKFIIPNKKFKEGCICYDVKVEPQKYLKCMIWINKQFELLQNKIDKINLFHVVPLRSSFISSHITIDTSCLISIFNDKGGNMNLFENVNKSKHEIWNRYFKINNRFFKKKGYIFSHMIKTDGVSCCALFGREDRISANGKVKDYNIKETKIVKNKKNEIENKYIEDEKNVNDLLKNMKFVTIDPNMGNLIHAIKEKNKNDTTNKLKRFKYTRNQRRFETHVKKYRNIRDDLLSKKINVNSKEQTIKEIQNGLSKYSSKTCNLKNFMNFVKHRNEIDLQIKDVYGQIIFRKLRLNTYTNTQKSESKMVKNFKQKMGEPNKTVIIYGDYDNNGIHLKGKEPIVSKKIRKVLREAKYKVYLINEHNTSKLCNICEHETEGFKERISIKPKYKGKNKKEEIWGLRRCSNLKCTVRTKNGKECERIYNRDDNAAMNMAKIVNHLKKYNERPKKYCRTLE